MPSPSRRPLAFVAEYQFADDNVLTATHHEEVRLKNEERVRNAQSVLKLKELSITEELSPIQNLKKIQREQDRQEEIDQHNLILLQRLEKIHHHLPKKFDVSHHSDEVRNAPRASNAPLRRKEQEKIAQENKRMKRRLHNTKGTFDLKQLAVDAEKHRYFSDQISKLGRRRKIQDACKHLSDLAALQQHAVHATPESFFVYDHGRQEAHHRPPGGHRAPAMRYQLHHAANDNDEEDEIEDDEDDDGASRVLPPVHRPARRPQHHHQRLNPSGGISSNSISISNAIGGDGLGLGGPMGTCSPTLTSSSKVISATDLLQMATKRSGRL